MENLKFFSIFQRQKFLKNSFTQNVFLHFYKFEHIDA